MKFTKSLFLRNLFYTLLQPGIVAGVVPYLLLRKYGDIPLTEWSLSQYGGFVLSVCGIFILLVCIVTLATEGRGTLSPADPTQALASKGLYRYSRNPMYIGVLLTLGGEAFFAASTPLWIYTGLILIAFNVFVVYFEEPRLRRDFNGAYEQYCRTVNRWL